MKSLGKGERAFTYGSLSYSYTLIRQERESLSLTIFPDLTIQLKAPLGVTESQIEVFLQKKWYWMKKQLRYFENYKHKRYKREYISGESYYYLGKQYQLIVQKEKTDSVALMRGRLFVKTLLPKSLRIVRRLLLNWYAKQSRHFFRERFEQMQKKFDYRTFPLLEIRDMNARWGSYTKSGKVVLNPKLIYVSMECIDYVITHELCHVRYKNHDQKFYSLLDRKSPRWKKIKEKLEESGALIQ